jgi:hypothetical protein
MAKMDISVTLRKDNGTNIGTTISVANQPSRTAAEAAVSAVIQARVDVAVVAQQDLLDAQAAFNS